MKTCGAFHPEDLSITCSLEDHPHPTHLGGFPLIEWPSDDYVAPLRRHKVEGTREFMARVAASIPSEQVFREESPYTDL